VKSGGAAIGVGTVVCLLVVCASGIIVMGSAATTPAAASSMGDLNVAAIPAAMEHLAPYVVEPGTLCAGVSPPQIAAQIDTESAWDPTAVSSAGAEGLAQFLPSTWASYGRNDDGSGDVSPFDPADAVEAMGRYDCANASLVAPLALGGKASLLSLMLAAYEGPGAVLASGGIPPAATAYVTTVEARIPRYMASAPAGSGFGGVVVTDAERELGVPYVWGGGSWTGPTTGGFDCSGLVLHAIAQASGGSIRLPHSSQLQATMGTPVSPGTLEPGDVIAFDLHTDATFDHIGIYVGDGEIIDAPYTGAVVRFDPLSAFGGYPSAIRRFS